MKVFGIAGHSGSGKTTLLENLISVLTREGLKVSIIEHAQHDFEVDQSNKDSYRHRKAGASEVLISSDQRWVLTHELHGERDVTLTQLLERFSPCDIVFVDGFKHEPIPKLEIHRAVAGCSLLYPNDPNIIAIATDEPLDTTLPQLDINYPEAVAYFIMKYLEFDVEAVRLLA